MSTGNPNDWKRTDNAGPVLSGRLSDVKGGESAGLERIAPVSSYHSRTSSNAETDNRIDDPPVPN